jgi:hypothetical protein
MRARYLWVVAVVAVAALLFCGSPAWADSTLHIGTGIGTACQAGCAGDPNLIGTGGTFDISQTAGGGPHNIADLWAILAVPNDSTQLSITLNSVTASSFGFDSNSTNQDIYTFVFGSTSLDNSNNFTNMEAADCSHDGICSFTGFGIYTFDLGVGLADGAALGITGVGIPLGTFAVGYGVDNGGNLEGTPFTEAGLTTTGAVTTPEPGALVLLGAGLLSVAGLLRRRFVNS